MPPKGTQKAKAAAPATQASKAKPAPIKTNAKAAAASSSSGSEESSPEPTPKKTPAKPVTPRKKKVDNTPYTGMDRDREAPIPIEVKYEGDSQQAKKIGDGVYGHTLKLDAANAFKLHKTVLITEGEYAGMQAIILQPAKPFPYLKLPKELRAKISTYYFAANNVVGDPIALEGKAKSGKIYAKLYSEGSPNRVALLTVNKEIYEEAVPILYDHSLRLESTTSLLDFLAQLENTVRSRLTKVCIKQFIKTTARNTMHFLAESPNIVELKIDTGVCTGEDPTKAAKEFYDNAYKFLEAVGGRKGDKAAGVDVLKFEKGAFLHKVDKGKGGPWEEEMVEEFTTALKAKMKSLQFSVWVCLCGSLVKGHSCSEEFNVREMKRQAKLRKRKQEHEQWEHIRHGAGMLSALPI